MTKNSKMSAPTKDVYDYIIQYMQRFGYPPTIREMSESCATSAASVVNCLVELQQSGYITRSKGKPRSIHLLKYGFVEL